MGYFDPHTFRILYGTQCPCRSCLQIRHLNHFVYPVQNHYEFCLSPPLKSHF